MYTFLFIMLYKYTMNDNFLLKKKKMIVVTGAAGFIGSQLLVDLTMKDFSI